MGAPAGRRGGPFDQKQKNNMLGGAIGGGLSDLRKGIGGLREDARQLGMKANPAWQGVKDNAGKAGLMSVVAPGAVAPYLAFKAYRAHQAAQAPAIPTPTAAPAAPDATDAYLRELARQKTEREMRASRGGSAAFYSTSGGGGGRR